MSTFERWAAMVDVSAGSDACWLWTASRNRQEYGHLGQRLTHRIAWEMFRFSIPAGVCVLHRCDNPPCCNPSHLFLGTVRDNNLDMKAKGRACRGERRSSLSAERVREIRTRFAHGERADTLRAEFSLSSSSVYRIINKEVWAHV